MWVAYTSVSPPTLRIDMCVYWFSPIVFIWIHFLIFSSPPLFFPNMVSYQGDQWVDFMPKLHKDYEQKESHDSELSSTFLTLSQVLEKKYSLYWHIRSFEEYVA